MRFKNYGLWIAIFAFIPLLSTALGTYDIRLVLPVNYDELVIGALGILVLAGILNSPTTQNKGFMDDK
ncbi:MAG: hypothetical protein JM58_09415 [Peptococcaceae bacterium BICA1-8]|nr:MAG: hypothetical protein JM58_09415 [Peptococcaceae bacterium BICA1-8]